MANSASHGALPYPIKNARYTVLVPFLDADGDPTDPTTPDTEVSKDNGAFADAAEEVAAASGARGVGMITLTGAETDCSILALWAGAASGPKATLMTLYPRVLPIVESGTAQAGAAGSITLAAGAAAYDLTGCFVRTTGGTGGGGTGGANNQARLITAYNTGTKVATISPNWETNPSSDTTYDVLLPDGLGMAALKALLPTVLGRTFDVSTGGEGGLDWANIGSPTTAQTLSGTSTKALEPTVAGRTLDVTAGGEAGIDLDNTAGALAKGTEITGFNDPTSAAIADAVWDELRADHVGVGSFGEGVVVQTNNDKTGYAIGVGGIAATSFAAGAINAAATATDFVNEIWAKIVEDQGSYTAQQVLSLVLASVTGVTDTNGSVFRTLNGTTIRLTLTYNASEERLTVAASPSAGA